MVGQVEKEKQNDGIRRWKFQSLKTIGKFLPLKINYVKAKFIKEKIWVDVGKSLKTKEFNFQITLSNASASRMHTAVHNLQIQFQSGYLMYYQQLNNEDNVKNYLLLEFIWL